MALLFCDGFDHYATADILKKWNASTVSGIAITTNGGRREGGGLNIYWSTRQYISKILSASAVTLIVGFAFKTTGFGSPTSSILAFLDNATTHMQLATDTSGHLIIARNGTVLATSSNVMLPNAVYYIETKVKIDDTTGTYDVLVNGESWLSGAGADTRNAGNASVNTIQIANCANATATFDDLYICDTSGSANNDFLGDVRIDTLLPNADGTYSDFTPNSGSNHYSRVAEGAPDTTTYVTSSTANAKDTYAFQDLTAVTGNILGIQVNNAALKDDAGARSIANVVRSGTTDQVGTTVALSTSQLIYSSIHETDPATSAAWTESGVNSMQAGVKVAA